MPFLRIENKTEVISSPKMDKHLVKTRRPCMRAHWFDFILVTIIVFLEFKGYLPHTPNSAIALFKKHVSWWTTETLVPEDESWAPKKVVDPVKKMSSTIKQIIQSHIASNKVAVLAYSGLNDYLILYRSFQSPTARMNHAI